MVTICNELIMNDLARKSATIWEGPKISLHHFLATVLITQTLFAYSVWDSCHPGGSGNGSSPPPRSARTPQ